MGAAERARIGLTLPRDPPERISVCIPPNSAPLPSGLQRRRFVEMEFVEHPVFERQLYDAIRSAATRRLHLGNRRTASQNGQRASKCYSTGHHALPLLNPSGKQDNDDLMRRQKLAASGRAPSRKRRQDSRLRDIAPLRLLDGRER